MPSRASTNFGTGSQNFLLTQSFFLNPGTTNLTFAVWAYFDGTSSNRTLCSQTDSSGTGRSWLVSQSADMSTFLGGSQKASGVSPTANQWDHYVVTCVAGAGGALNIYRNGANILSTTVTAESTVGDHKLATGKIDTQSYGGNLAYAQIYNAALTQSQIQEIMRNPFAHPENLQWMPDLLEDGTYRDLSPSQRGNPTITGTLTASALGPPVNYYGTV